MTIIKHKKLEPLFLAIERVTEAWAASAEDEVNRLRIAIAKLEQTHDDREVLLQDRLCHQDPDILEQKVAVQSQYCAETSRRSSSKASSRKR